MTFSRLKSTYSVLFHFMLFVVFMSFLLRGILMFISFGKSDIHFTDVLRIFSEGLLFDIGVAFFLVAPYGLYLLLLPAQWSNKKFNRIITYTFFSLNVFLILFTFLAEVTFWQEFESRFNFIAVDYLVYTYEVINNINQTYPLPILIAGILAATGLVLYFFKRKHYFFQTFSGAVGLRQRLVVSLAAVGIILFYSFAIDNNQADRGGNRYQNELSKAGIYAFFAAFKNNEISYDLFYKEVPIAEAFNIMRQQVSGSQSRFLENDLSIRRIINTQQQETRPNVIMITIESFNADFMARFGSEKQLTPVLDSLAARSIVFTNMYATGTRTVRGMEALSLAIPPTPGSSIVRRPGNDNLETIGNVFAKKGYKTGFFYGGDGYFDNMNHFFGNNGYAVTDRGRHLLARDKLAAAHHIIPDSTVRFENAWGICDEDLYAAVTRDADIKYASGMPFYNFVMTTSNHRPYTYPAGEIAIAPGTGRDGAVSYTDYAIGRFLQAAQPKPWFSNTIFIFVADHCASSAGKNEIDISKYHIPAIIFNLKEKPIDSINKLCSQIDLYPTLFSLLNWSYSSNFFGEDVLSPLYEPRALMGTYQKLAYLKNDSLIILSPQRLVESFLYNKSTNEQVPVPSSPLLVAEAIAQYQVPYYLFKHGGLKQ